MPPSWLLDRVFFAADVAIVVASGLPNSLRPEAGHLKLPDSLKYVAIPCEVFLENDVQLVRYFLKVAKQLENPMMRLLLDLDKFVQGVDYDLCVLLTKASFEIG